MTSSVGLARLAWTTFIVACTAALFFMPVGPDITELIDANARSDWFATADPDQIAGALLRFAALAVSVWLATLTIASLVLSALGLRHAAALAARGLPSIARRALRPIATSALAVSVSVGSMAGVAAAQTAPTETAPTGTASEDTRPSNQAVPATTASSERAVAVLTHLDGQWPAYEYPGLASELPQYFDTVGLDPVETSGPGGPTRPMPPTPDSGRDSSQWVVQAGDHFWSIAQRTAPSEASDEQFIAHWKAIIELNRQSLPTPPTPTSSTPVWSSNFRRANRRAPPTGPAFFGLLSFGASTGSPTARFYRARAIAALRRSRRSNRVDTSPHSATGPTPICEESVQIAHLTNPWLGVQALAIRRSVLDRGRWNVSHRPSGAQKHHIHDDVLARSSELFGNP